MHVSIGLKTGHIGLDEIVECSGAMASHLACVLHIPVTDSYERMSLPFRAVKALLNKQG